MRVRTIILSVFALLIVVSLIYSSSALTASIGNSRMVLRVAPGQSIGRSILVQNVNNVSVTINLLPDGDLANYITIAENNFTLLPGDEKKVNFTIQPQKEGTTTSRINVKFTPDKGNSVGLASTIIVHAGTSTDNTNDNNIPAQGSPGNDNEINNSNPSTINPASSQVKTNSSSFTISPLIILLISSLVLVMLLIFLVLYSAIKPKKSAKAHAK